jgi:hypothetical protein
MLEASGVDHAKARASALSSLLAGLTFSDQIIQIPIGGAEEGADRKQLIARVIQTILTEKLS